MMSDVLYLYYKYILSSFFLCSDVPEIFRLFMKSATVLDLFFIICTKMIDGNVRGSSGILN